jgi:hypothetical protein
MFILFFQFTVMTPKKLFFVILITAGCMAGCKDKQADTPETEKAAQQPVQTSYVVTGSWVGMFEPDKIVYVYDKKTEDSVPVTANKLTLFINKLANGDISGYSVCAGNERKCIGSYEEEGDKIKAVLQEPGDNKYDGVFELEIGKNERTLTGKWTPYNKTQTGRHFSLERKDFKYNSSLGEFPQASQRMLTADDINNMYKEELRQMRNEIYARHGYSFKLRDMRNLFDSQDWYIPVSTDVRNKLSAIEVKNEKLIKNFEQYAEESYDDYGR